MLPGTEVLCVCVCVWERGISKFEIKCMLYENVKNNMLRSSRQKYFFSGKKYRVVVHFLSL